MFSVVIILKPIKIFKRFLKVLKINHYVITGVYKRLWQKKKKKLKNAATEMAVSKEMLHIFSLVSVFSIKLLVNQ